MARTAISGPARQAPASAAGEHAAKLRFRYRPKGDVGDDNNDPVVVPPTDTHGAPPGVSPRTESTRAKAPSSEIPAI